ncbi:MAG: DUF393 domain-containing protein [Propionicimonas sp.]|uniref:thiol-disulfide oxidoreductase DCC family protein n=1 Tax=Propionicimonas sp. TaxID=1955623 RepID=UPI002B1FF78F|nr:DUF393 domain-containing protein [Propionicimonas sp.]MEA4944378.1 DUF393 domain-containing protein [Propionicimonas sp.]MEA5052014.1 DUF393 domain-containing protein [Propionicimonas sp.]
MSTTILYDADCGFCTRSARWLVRRGVQARVVPLQSVELESLGVDPERAKRELPAVTDAGVAYGAGAIRAALATGPWWMRAAAACLAPAPLAALAEAGYRWVAANRHHLPGGTDVCSLDPGPRS